MHACVYVCVCVCVCVCVSVNKQDGVECVFVHPHMQISKHSCSHACCSFLLINETPIIDKIKNVDNDH